ncbi:hypothetical protein HDV02_003439 [Globomyces sp. JEL0801]|nr:hypothetical protein HDV02_003439 [Globomyces sp. JEL0801]
MNSLRSPKCTFDLQEILDLSEIQIEKPATNSKVVDMDTKESLKPSMNQKPKPQFHFMKTFETCTEPTKPTEHQPQKPQQPRCQFHFMQDVTNTTETKPMDVNPTRTKKTKKSKKPDEQNILFERYEEQQRKKQTKRNMGNSSSYKKPCSASRKRHYTRKEPPYPYPRRKRYNDYRSELALAVYEILFPQLLDIEHYRQCYLKNRAKKRQAETASTNSKRSKFTFFKRVWNLFKNDKAPESESVEPTVKSEVLNDAMTNTASEVQSSTEDMNKLNDETKESKTSVENVQVKENTKRSKKWSKFR